MKIIFVIACFLLLSLVAATSEQAYRKAFDEWTATYGKSYESQVESEHRFQMFKANFDFVKKWDAKARGFEVALNKFADLSNKEFNDMYNGLKPRSNAVRTNPIHQAPLVIEALPSTVNWTAKGVVTPIKNQGQCGSCWSFSTTGSVESAIAMASGDAPVGLSEQNLMDCSTSEGNEGCDGGLMDDAFQYIISNKGLDTEASYPYTAEDGTCHYNAANSGGYIAGFTDVQSKSESALQSAAAQQPVSVAIDASHVSFQLYSSGVYYELFCSQTSLDHGVLVAGYGTWTDNKAYWQVKNSWGSDWGMNGYILMSRNRNNNCGIATEASYPTGAVSV